MPRKLLSVLILGLVLFRAAAAVADGDIYVGGPWGTRITSLPYTITAPGAYYLGSNLTHPSTGIIVAPGVSHVTLDLMGFTLNGSGMGEYGIYLNGSKNVEIRNGTVTGYGRGISETSYDNGMLHRIINVRVVGNTGGIMLAGGGHIVTGCEVTVTGAGSYDAISITKQGTVSGCTVKFGNAHGIKIYDGGIISNNVVISTGTGTPRHGISFSSQGTLIKSNKVSGCAYGIYGLVGNGMNVIGNTVDAASGTTGFYLNDDYAALLDQNTVTGAGSHYNAAYARVQMRSNY